jgi:hypothetical protein
MAQDFGSGSNVYIAFREVFTEAKLVIEGVVTHIICNTWNDVFEDTLCI